jgi:hypothetical protein
MRGIRIAILVLLAAGLALAGYALVMKESRPLPEGDQEIAWIHAATSGLIWERFVGGIQRFEASAEGQAVGVQVDYDRAFLDQTAATPEVVIGCRGSTGRLHIRWYKLTSTTDNAYWARHLAERELPPLAIIGGGSSDRARDLARELHVTERRYGSRTPILLITTATADRVFLGDERVEGHELTQIYAGRSFRYCFTNSQMADALTDFVLTQPDLRPHGAEGPGAGTPAPVFTLEWKDDPYSLDLAEHFRADLRERLPCRIVNHRVPYSTGDYYRPNVPESAAVSELARELTQSPGQRPLLVLPAGDKQIRRVLRALTAAVPLEVRNAVAVTGDSMNLDVIFRDRATSWNIQEMPIPLVLFAHEDPVDWKSPPSSPGALTPTPLAGEGGGGGATHDLLLNAKIARLLVEAAWIKNSSTAGELVDSADKLCDRLQQLEPAFFGPGGNRLTASGAYVVCLRPQIEQGRVLPTGTISVWLGRAEGVGPQRHWSWQRQKHWQVDYGDRTSGR